LACRVVASLLKNLTPQGMALKMELRREMNMTLMKKEDDPESLFQPISALENKYNAETLQITNEEDMTSTTIFLENAPKEYGTILTTEMRAKGNSLSMDDLSNAMKQLCHTLYSNSNTSMIETEVALIVGVGDENIACYRCKQKGHKAYQCQLKGNNDGSNHGKGGNKCSTRKCHYCDQTRHKAEDCFKDPKNAIKVPACI
jgi:hypothetical protein